MKSDHQKYKAFIKVASVIIFVVGIIFAIIGFVSFFSTFGSRSMSPPRYFWCVFVGFPLIALGFSGIKASFLGEIARYTSQEVTPVIGDAARSVAHRIKEGLDDDNKLDSHQRLKQLEKMKSEGLISGAEYSAKRKEILDQL